eukprot:482325-Prorocentrum_minimum.AAC.1
MVTRGPVTRFITLIERSGSADRTAIEHPDQSIKVVHFITVPRVTLSLIARSFYGQVQGAGRHGAHTRVRHAKRARHAASKVSHRQGGGAGAGHGPAGEPGDPPHRL